MNRSLVSRRLPIASCLAAAALLFAPAVPAADLPSARVYLGDLDLGTVPGQQVARRRIASAIEEVCKVHSPVTLPTTRIRWEVRECRERAFAGVQLQLEQHGLPRLPGNGFGRS